MAPEPPLSQCRQEAEWFFGLAFSGAVLRSSRGAAVETRSLWTVRMLRTNWPAIFKLCQVDSVTMFSVDGCRILVHADLIGSSVTLFGTLVVWIDRNGAGTIQGLVYPPHKTVHGSKEWPRTAERLLFRVFPWWIVELHVSLHQIGTSPHVVDYFFFFDRLWPGNSHVCWLNPYCSSNHFKIHPWNLGQGAFFIHFPSQNPMGHHLINSLQCTSSQS